MTIGDMAHCVARTASAALRRHAAVSSVVAAWFALGLTSCVQTAPVTVICGTGPIDLPIQNGTIELSELTVFHESAAVIVPFVYDRGSGVFPTAARKARMHGTVELSGTLDSGGLHEIVVARGINPLLDRAAVNLARTVCTVPFMPNKAYRLIVTFSLQDS